MSAQDIVSRLEHCRQTGRGQWIACCPAHDDRSPSLSITEKTHRETGEEIILINCHAGCGATEVLDAIGLDYSALYPSADKHLYRAEKQRYERSYDELVLEIAAADRKRGRELTQSDLDLEAEAFARVIAGKPSPEIDPPSFAARAYRQSRKIKKTKNRVTIPDEISQQNVEGLLADYFGGQ